MRPTVVVITVSGCHLILVICGCGEMADLDQVEAERVDLNQHAVECRPIQEAGEHSVGAVPLRHQRWERGQHRGAEVAVGPDRIQDGCWVREVMVEAGR